MSRTYSLLFAFSLTILPALHAEKIDNRNFAIDTCFPTPNEIQLAEGRTRAYWAKHASRFGAEPRFLAVETSKIFPGQNGGQALGEILFGVVNPSAKLPITWEKRSARQPGRRRIPFTPEQRDGTEHPLQ